MPPPLPTFTSRSSLPCARPGAPPRGQGARALALLILLASVAGCSPLGPHSLARDRLDYSENVARSWKEQTLLNLVKLRYMDVPVFLDVGQIVSGYTFEAGADLSGSIVWPNAADAVGLGGSVRYTDRPTITYTPLTGEAFLRSVISPIPPLSVFFLLQSGYPADFVLGLAVNSLNGIRNPMTTSAGARERASDFGRLVEILRELQLHGGLGLRAEPGPDRSETVVVFFRPESLTEPLVAKLNEAKDLLGVDRTQMKLRLIESPIRAGADELAVQTRSVLQSLLALSGAVEVPLDDVNEGRAVPLPPPDADTRRSLPFVIRSGRKGPPDAFVSVKYRGRDYWIDDTDWRSKRVFAFILLLFTLSGNRGSERLPLLTIPTG